ncbi:MAG: PAS domain S-box protein [Candidatus Latescibacterota bacterium]|nr:MAG: PAS domain S-box protein [Candidatus Latescibacterota bacterium]
MTSKNGRKFGRRAVPPKMEDLVLRALDYSTDGIAIGAIDGTIYYHNKAWFDIHNWSSTYDVRGRNIKDVEREELKPVLSAVFKDLHTKGHFTGTFGITRPDGFYHDILINAQIIKRFKPPVVVAILRRVTELVQAKKAIERRSAELAVLNEIHRVMTSARDRRTIVRGMLRLLGDFVGACAAGIYEVDPSLDYVSLIDCYGLPALVRRRVERMPLTDGAFARILASRRLLVMEEDMPRHRGGRGDIRKAMGFSRVMSLVFRAGAKRKYLVIFGLKAESEIGREVRRFLETAAGQFGIALDRVELVEKLREREGETKRRAKELSMFAKLHNSMVSSGRRSVVLRKMFGVIRDYIGATGVAMYRVERAAEYAELIDYIGFPPQYASAVRRVPVSAKAFSMMMKSKRAIVIEDAMPNYRGGPTDVRKRIGLKMTLGFVFRTGGRTDYLLVIGFGRKKHITSELNDFLESVGRHFSIAVERLDFIDTLEAREAELHALNARLREAGEEERRQCALRLHDEFGQTLAGLHLDLAAMEKRYPAPDARTKEAFAGAREKIRSIANSMRNLSKSLHPALLDELGLVPTLEWYAGEWKRESGIDVRLSSAGFDTQPPRPVSVALYRVVQECLANVRKHSGASRVKIMLAKGYPFAILNCEDNGKGFSINEGIRRKKGLGLVSMRERVEFLGGSFQIKSSPGKGTQVRVKIPLEGHHAR